MFILRRLSPGLTLRFDTETDTGTEMMSKSLIVDMDTRMIFDSAEFVLFNHSQRISVVTRTSSIYGVLEETRLTSTHPFHIPLLGITLGDVQEKP